MQVFKKGETSLVTELEQTALRRHLLAQTVNPQKQTCNEFLENFSNLFWTDDPIQFIAFAFAPTISFKKNTWVNNSKEMPVVLCFTSAAGKSIVVYPRDKWPAGGVKGFQYENDLNEEVLKKVNDLLFKTVFIVGTEAERSVVCTLFNCYPNRDIAYAAATNPHSIPPACKVELLKIRAFKNTDSTFFKKTDAQYLLARLFGIFAQDRGGMQFQPHLFQSKKPGDTLFSKNFLNETGILVTNFLTVNFFIKIRSELSQYCRSARKGFELIDDSVAQQNPYCFICSQNIQISIVEHMKQCHGLLYCKKFCGAMFVFESDRNQHVCEKQKYY